MIGSGIKDRNWKNVHILGKKGPNEIISIMKACQYQMHLCQIDSCPNAVVEGLACGLNILCTNLGGTPELVKNNGVVINVDKWHDRKHRPENCDPSDNVNPSIVAQGIHDLLNLKERSVRTDVNINYIAEQYVKLVENILS